MYIPKYFKIYELMPKHFYSENKHRGNLLWLFFDERILWTIDKLRSIYGPLVANDYIWGGDKQYRGWRPFECLIGKKFSQHKFGRAVDFEPVRFDLGEMRKQIIAGKRKGKKEFRFIKAIEADVPWIHIDCRNSFMDDSFVVFRSNYGSG